MIQPQRTPNRSEWQRAFNKISAKHFDFVLCDPSSLQVVAAIELDDSSHSQSKRVQRDDFLNQAVATAGLPLVRFPVRKSYIAAQIQSKVQRSLEK